MGSLSARVCHDRDGVSCERGEICDVAGVHVLGLDNPTSVDRGDKAPREIGLRVGGIDPAGWDELHLRICVVQRAEPCQASRRLCRKEPDQFDPVVERCGDLRIRRDARDDRQSKPRAALDHSRPHTWGYDEPCPGFIGEIDVLDGGDTSGPNEHLWVEDQPPQCGSGGLGAARDLNDRQPTGTQRDSKTAQVVRVLSCYGWEDTVLAHSLKDSP